MGVTPYYEPEGGGLERYAHAMLSRLAARGHEVRALAFTRQALPSGVHDGVAVQRCRPRFRFSNTPVDPRFRGRARALIRAWRPDVLYLHTPVPFPAEMAALAAERERVPFVVAYHSGRLAGHGSAMLEALAAFDRATLERRMLRRAARLVAVSTFVRDHALAEHAARVRIVPPGVDAELYKPGPVPVGHDVLFVGPLDHAYTWKGIDTLWRAFRRVRALLPDARLVLVGDGDRRAEFASLARRDGLDDAVVFRGRLSVPDLVRAYQEATVVTLPSVADAESFGMVLAEASACGRPVVGSRIGGIPSFVRDGENGLLAEPGDAHGLASALLQLLTDPERAEAMGASGRARVVEQHDWDDLARRTEALLLGAAGREALPLPRVAREAGPQPAR